MDTSRKPNANAGKTGGRYRGGPGEHMGTNNVAPGAGVSARARVRTQAHRAGSASSANPQDMSKKSQGERSWAPGAGNAEPMGNTRTGTVNLPAGDRPRRRIAGRN